MRRGRNNEERWRREETEGNGERVGRRERVRRGLGKGGLGERGLRES